MVGYEKERRLYFCEICKLHYRSRKLAEECQAWCSKHESCNLSIAGQSVEAEEYRRRKGL